MSEGKKVSVKPVRLVRRRTKGFRLADVCENPNGYVIVDRTSKFGNHFIIGEWYEEAWVKIKEDAPLYAPLCVRCEPPVTAGESLRRFKMNRVQAVKYYRVFAEAQVALNPGWLSDVDGRDVACTCELDSACHGDVLLEISERLA